MPRSWLSRLLLLHALFSPALFSCQSRPEDTAETAAPLAAAARADRRKIVWYVTVVYAEPVTGNRSTRTPPWRPCPPQGLLLWLRPEAKQ
jgi:hypothetical protein